VEVGAVGFRGEVEGSIHDNVDTANAAFTPFDRAQDRLRQAQGERVCNCLV